MFGGRTVRMCAIWQKNKRKVVQTVRQEGGAKGAPSTS